MPILTDQIENATRFECFSAAAEMAERWIGGSGFFDGVSIDIQHKGDHWIVKLGEPGDYPSRWFA